MRAPAALLVSMLAVTAAHAQLGPPPAEDCEPRYVDIILICPT